MSHDLRVKLAHALRDASGLGIQAVREAMADAENNLNGDYAVAALARYANGLAIHVKCPDAGTTPEQARRQWDLERAKDRKAADPAAWFEIDDLSRRLNEAKNAQETP